ncbi:MAG TPA: ABC transporter substrate-binding protein [Gemmatimonadaceae bacterium]|nr:ABC transporter substrate-binding protein [Gemmatimonadaceae bacterium]
MPRIVSFLPAGTEIVHALGAGDQLVGRSHECDFPASVQALPIVSRPTIDLDGASAAGIDQAVATRLDAGHSLYAIDEVLLEELRPDVILTQNLCRVCAPSGDELTRAVRKFRMQPSILFLTPRSLAEIEENIIAVGEAIGRERDAAALVAVNRERMEAVSLAVRDAPTRKVSFLEWTEPLFCAGHWVPEMIALAGGHDALGKPGGDSVRIEWSDVLMQSPENVIVSPCGYRLEQSVSLATHLPAIPNATVYAVDANAYFARPGPRVAEGVELLGHLFHPDRVSWNSPIQPWARLGQ